MEKSAARSNFAAWDGLIQQLARQFADARL
jgi:hypothetical protein